MYFLLTKVYMVAYLEKAKFKMLTFKINPQGKRKQFKSYESTWPNLLIYAQPCTVRGNTAAHSWCGQHKNPSLGWEKETPFKTTEQICTRLDTVQLLEFPTLININVSLSCWLVLHLDNQLGLISFWLSFWSVSIPMFSEFSTEWLPADPRRRLWLLISSHYLGQVSQGVVRTYFF